MSRVAGNAMNSQGESCEPLHRLGGLLRRSSVRRAIVRLLLEGCTRKQIALELNRSQHTIDAHLKAIYRAIGIGDRARVLRPVDWRPNELAGPKD